MTCVYYEARKQGYRLELVFKTVRRSMWLGKVSKRQAEVIRMHVDALKVAADTGTTPEPATLNWSKQVGERIRNRLIEWGLIEARLASSSIRLREWCDKVLDMEQHKGWATNTRYQMVKVADLLVTVIGDKPLDSVNESDAEKFGKHVYGREESKSETHGGKQVKRARQYFNIAIKARMLDRNPFSAIKASTQIDKTRKAYVSIADAELVLEKCPGQLWRVIFCLARYCGLRVPSEILQLEWSFVDWEKSRLKIVAPKQKRHKHRHIRHCPLPPNVMKEIRELYDTAEEGSRYICEKYRSTKSTAQFRAPLIGAINAAGLEVWPKLYVNLRASARTDLKKLVPEHVVNEWLGHDSKVGEMHYDRITEADWATITTTTVTTTTKAENEKSREIPAQNDA